MNRTLLVVMGVALFTLAGGCKKEETTEPLINDPPTSPSEPTPFDGAVVIATSPTLSWTCTDPNADSITYDLYLGTGNLPSTPSVSNWRNPSYAMSGLAFNTTYYWRIRARDSKGDTAIGSTWRFRTADSGMAGSAILQASSPQTTNMSYQCGGSEFDTYYTNPPHWKITTLNGYMLFGFSGQHTFKFRALGSTSGGVSYCHVNVLVNGTSYWPDLFVDQNWSDYAIPSSSFGTGNNTVRIVLTGSTHFWIVAAWVQ